MVDFLSAEWIEALDAAARAATLPEAASAASVTIEQVVRDAPGGESRYHLRIEDGHARVQLGPATAPDLRLSAGRLKMQGRFAHLLRVDDALRALEDVFAPVRADTTYRQPGRSR